MSQRWGEGRGEVLGPIHRKLCHGGRRGGGERGELNERGG